MPLATWYVNERRGVSERDEVLWTFWRVGVPQKTLSKGRSPNSLKYPKLLMESIYFP